MSDIHGGNLVRVMLNLIPCPLVQVVRLPLFSRSLNWCRITVESNYLHRIKIRVNWRNTYILSFFIHRETNPPLANSYIYEMKVLTCLNRTDLERLRNLKISQLKLEVTYQTGDKFNATMWFFWDFLQKISL